MNADKRKALEAAGWKFGSADEFLCERRMSDSDKMRAEFESWAESKCMSLTKINWKCGSVSEYAYTATFDAWQVWQAGYQAGQKAEREAIFIEWENGELLAAEVERLRAELAAAKAASVVPVKWKSAEQFFQSGADRGNQWGIELWFENKEQREQFHKWLKERGEG